MRLYRALLHLYPASFRHEYGGEMAAVFRRQSRSASGMAGRTALWVQALGEVARGAAAVHLEILGRDLRIAVRHARRAPGFALTAMLLIALGTGANTAVFAVADFVLLRPLAFPESHRLVRLWESVPGYSQMELSPPNYRDWKSRLTGVEAFGALTLAAANLSGEGGPPLRLEGASVSGEVFGVLGVPAAVGRTIEPSDAASGAVSSVVLSHALWQQRFGGDPTVVGRTIRLDGQPLDVVGVMPQDFAFPRREVAFWVPLVLDENDFLDRNNNYLTGIARLRPGVSIEALRIELETITAALELAHPVENADARATVVSMRGSMSSTAQTMLVALVAAAVCVLLIAGVNLANLTLARGLGRRQELAVRAALGAGRDRLARQLATETLTLAAAGGAAGVALGALTVPLLLRLVPDALPMTGEPGLDGRVLAVSLVSMLVIGLGAGLAPLLGGGIRRPAALRDAGRGIGPAGERVRGALVVVGIASSVVLLVTAGLLMRTLTTLQAQSPGFVADGGPTARTALPTPAFDETARRTQWYQDVIAEVEAVPGVSRAAYISFAPQTMGGGIWPVILEAGDVRREDGQVASLRFVTPGVFDVLGIPLHRGRDVRWSDDVSQPFVAVVSASMAERFWPGTDPLGQRFEFGFFERTVVGVVGDVSNRGPERVSEPQVYLPAGQVPDGGLSFYAPKDLLIQSALAPAVLEGSVRRIVSAISPEQPVSDVRPLAAIVRDQTASRSVQLTVIGIFAGVALLLAGLGIHGLLGFVVSQRSREIGLRMALGADRGDVFRMVTRRTAWLLLAGLAPGLAVASLAGRGLESALVGVSRADPVAYGGALTLCVIMAALGCLAPLRRAVRIEPASALRSE